MRLFSDLEMTNVQCPIPNSSGAGYAIFGIGQCVIGSWSLVLASLGIGHFFSDRPEPTVGEKIASKQYL